MSKRLKLTPPTTAEAVAAPAPHEDVPSGARDAPRRTSPQAAEDVPLDAQGPPKPEAADLVALSVPPEDLPPGMRVHVGAPHVATTLDLLATLGARRAFVLCNRSSRTFLGGDDDPSKLLGALTARGLLAAPLCSTVGMGGGELGLLAACDAARAASADAVVTVGGGAVQDAGKLVRLWLAAGEANTPATVAGLTKAAARDPLPKLPPQVALPNAFAMAEATAVAGLTTRDRRKGGAAHPALLPTAVVYDPTLGRGLPAWVRFGTALRCVEHAVGAATHPAATEAVRARALAGLRIVARSLRRLVRAPECPIAGGNLYVGGFVAVRALNAGCYPSLGHLVQNQYAARFDVHQGSCSGLLCGRVLAYHLEASREHQQRIAEALGDGAAPAPRLVRDLVARLPAVSAEHAQEGVTDGELREFARWMFEHHLPRYNSLSPKRFESAEDMYGMMTKPLAEL